MCGELQLTTSISGFAQDSFFVYRFPSLVIKLLPRIGLPDHMSSLQLSCKDGNYSLTFLFFRDVEKKKKAMCLQFNSKLMD